MLFLDHDEVVRRLSYELCIPAVREAMRGLARGEAKQIPRAVMAMSEGRLMGLMGGALGANAVFGGKVVSAFNDNFARDLPSHQGLVLVFDPETGSPVCAADAGAVTAIRTAAASAVATDALAHAGANRLAILGYGEQARAHARAIGIVRPIASVSVWGRSPERAKEFAARLADELHIDVAPAESAERAVAKADIVCTVTAAREPILMGRWIGPGVHVNVVGSSMAGPAEVDGELVAKSRFIADCRENVLRAGAEFLRAKDAGLVSDDHVVAEIGEVLNGDAIGRCRSDDITLYKSLGHIVQDLAAVRAIFAGGA